MRLQDGHLIPKRGRKTQPTAPVVRATGIQAVQGSERVIGIVVAVGVACYFLSRIIRRKIAA
jgi:hypothetical protein